MANGKHREFQAATKRSTGLRAHQVPRGTVDDLFGGQVLAQSGDVRIVKVRFPERGQPEVVRVHVHDEWVPRACCVFCRQALLDEEGCILVEAGELEERDLYGRALCWSRALRDLCPADTGGVAAMWAAFEKARLQEYEAFGRNIQGAVG